MHFATIISYIILWCRMTCQSYGPGLLVISSNFKTLNHLIFGVNSSNSNFPRSLIAVFNWSALSQVYVLKKKSSSRTEYICMYSLHIYALPYFRDFLLGQLFFSPMSLSLQEENVVRTYLHTWNTLGVPTSHALASLHEGSRRLLWDTMDAEKIISPKVRIRDLDSRRPKVINLSELSMGTFLDRKQDSICRYQEAWIRQAFPSFQ
jgi:hypothetical protein